MELLLFPVPVGLGKLPWLPGVVPRGPSRSPCSVALPVCDLWLCGMTGTSCTQEDSVVCLSQGRGSAAICARARLSNWPLKVTELHGASPEPLSGRSHHWPLVA